MNTEPRQDFCKTCNAPHTNTLHRIWIRCGTCKVINGKLPPSNYIPVKPEVV